MKKLLLITAVCLLASAKSFAQYAPEAGTITTEIQFNPFDQDGKNFSVDGLKLRYFLSEKHALRATLGFGMANSKNSNKNEEEKTEWNGKAQKGNFKLNLGYEYHINIAPRLSAYVGAGTGFKVLTAKTHLEYSEDGQKQDFDLKGLASNSIASIDDLKDWENNPTEQFGRAGFEYNLGAFAGIDFYVYKGLYCGAEFGVEFSTISYKKPSAKLKEGSKTTEYKSNYKLTATDLSFRAVPNIRLGWRF